MFGNLIIAMCVTYKEGGVTGNFPTLTKAEFPLFGFLEAHTHAERVVNYVPYRT